MTRLTNKKGISTIAIIILVLCAAFLGALTSYLWVMSNYYMEPEDIVDLVITGVNFSVNHADYFYVTVMNPTHSPSKTNITEIYFTVEGNDTKYNAEDTDPKLPLTLERGNVVSIKCNKNWGEFANKTITVHVTATNASGATYSFKTEFVKLHVQVDFNATESIEYFNLTVRNDVYSKINLTLTSVAVDYEPITNASINLPRVVSIGEAVAFRCFYNWQGLEKPVVTVETEEGYIVELSKEVPSTALLAVTEVVFSETDPTKLNVTLWNSPESETPVDFVNVTLTDENGTEYLIGDFFDYPVRVYKNETVTLECTYNWTEYRDRNATVKAYTKQGFEVASKTVKTPSPVMLKITKLNLSLVNVKNFYVTIQNMPCSIREANINGFMLNLTGINVTTPLIPYILGIGEYETFNCTFDWAEYKGLNVTITVYTTDGFNATSNLVLPQVLLDAQFDSSKSTKYFSLNIQNHAYTSINVTGIRINSTEVNATLTYPTLPVTVGDNENVTLICPFDWQTLSGQTVTITIATENGFEIENTVKIP